MKRDLYFILSLIVLAACLLAIYSPVPSPRVGVGTDSFWSYHDQLFPSHYEPGPEGKVLCSETQAKLELNRAGIETED